MAVLSYVDNWKTLTGIRLLIDCAVIDLSMPVKSGLKFMSDVSQFPNPPRIQVLTANKDASCLQRVLALGGLDTFTSSPLQKT